MPRAASNDSDEISPVYGSGFDPRKLWLVVRDYEC